MKKQTQKGNKDGANLEDIARDCGETEMPIPETCELLGIPVPEFLERDDLRVIYRLGQLRTKLKIRKAVVSMAAEGNAAMVKIYLDNYADTGEIPEKPVLLGGLEFSEGDNQ